MALSLTATHFVTKMEENVKRVADRLNDYIKDSNENNIHDIRTATRRLDASFTSLPKKMQRKTIQLAKYLGAYITTTVSTNDMQFVREMGANQVIDYKTQNFEDILNDYDAVFNIIGGETYKRSFKVLKKGGIIVSMLEQPNLELMNQYGVKAIFQFTQVNRDRLTKLAQWADENNIMVNVEKTFPLDEAGNALDYLKDIHPRGKVVLTV